MLTTFNEIDMSNLMSMRTQYKDQFMEKHGVKLGFMSAFIKASARALKAEPAVNAIIDGDEIVYRDYVDVSVAVSAPKGLVVPVLRNVDAMTFADVERSERVGRRDGVHGVVRRAREPAEPVGRDPRRIAGEGEEVVSTEVHELRDFEVSELTRFAERGADVPVEEVG